MRFRITSREGSMDEAEWEYAPRNVRGCAKNIRFLSGNRTTFEDVSFTTCKRDDDSWFISMNDLEIDEYDLTASGTGAVLHFQNVPIFGVALVCISHQQPASFGLPHAYLRHELDSRRRYLYPLLLQYRAQLRLHAYASRHDQARRHAGQ